MISVVGEVGEAMTVGVGLVDNAAHVPVPVAFIMTDDVGDGQLKYCTGPADCSTMIFTVSLTIVGTLLQLR